jgi:hypothetical protein
MRLRQVALVARDLDTTVAGLCEALGVEVCFRDPGVVHFGLHNALMAIGDTFLEVVSPVREGTTAGRYLDRRGGDGGYMAMFQVDDLAAARARIDGLGVRVVWQGDGDGISGMHLHPADVGGAIVSFDQASPADSWGWAGRGWREHVHSGTVQRIAALELQSDDPARLRRRWSEVLGADLPAVRFVEAADGRGEGIGGIDLVASDRNRAGERIELAGIRVQLV